MKKNHRRYQFPDGSNYPIVEATEAGMILMAQECDVLKATPKSPTECALAQCAMRMGAEKAYIAGSVAYIVLPWKGGELVAVKQSVPARTQKAIKLFDETGYMPPEGFVLAPLAKSRTRKVKAIENGRRTVEQRKGGGRSRGIRDEVRTYRHLTGHVRTVEDAVVAR